MAAAKFNPACLDCAGTGKYTDEDGDVADCLDCPPPACSLCEGEGTITKHHWSNDPQREKEAPCPECGDNLDADEDVWREQHLVRFR